MPPDFSGLPSPRFGRLDPATPRPVPQFLSGIADIGCRLHFFANVDELHLFVHKNCAAFADILAAYDGDGCLDILRKIHHAFVIRGIYQNVAVAQNEWSMSDKITGKIDNATSSILHRLCRVLNSDVVARTVA